MLVSSSHRTSISPLKRGQSKMSVNRPVEFQSSNKEHSDKDVLSQRLSPRPRSNNEDRLVALLLRFPFYSSHLSEDGHSFRREITNFRKQNCTIDIERQRHEKLDGIATGAEASDEFHFEHDYPGDCDEARSLSMRWRCL